MSKDDEAVEDFGLSAEFLGFDSADEAADDVDGGDAAFATALFAAALADEPAPTASTPALIATARLVADRSKRPPVDQLALRRGQRRKNWVTGVLVAAAVGAVAVLAGPKLFNEGASNAASSGGSVVMAAPAATSAAGAASTAAPEYASGSDSGGSFAAGAASAASSAAQSAPLSSAASAQAESSADQPATEPGMTSAASSGKAPGAQRPVPSARPTSGSAAECRWTLLPADAVQAAKASLRIPIGTQQQAVIGQCPEDLVGGVRIPASRSTPGLTITVIKGEPGACLSTGSCTSATGADSNSHPGSAGGVVVYEHGLEATVVADLPADGSVSQDDLAAAGRAVLDALR